MRKWVLLLAIVISGMALPAGAIDRTGQVGLGFGRSVLMGLIGTDGGAIVTVDGISGRYWFDDTSGVEALIGFHIGEEFNGYTLGGSYLHSLLRKARSNVYARGGLALDLIDSDAGDENWFVLDGGLGTEFSFTGLDEISFFGEIGLEYTANSGDSSLATRGDYFGGFGFHYYF